MSVEGKILTTIPDPPAALIGPFVRMNFLIIADDLLAGGLLRELHVERIREFCRICREAEFLLKKLEKHSYPPMCEIQYYNSVIDELDSSAQKHFARTIDELREFGVKIPEKFLEPQS